ncbi:MAG: DUF192 domain-containing protein [Kiritimatiellia bacterium]|jgi:uncharacterized membrane protein (UPF0127 family)
MASPKQRTYRGRTIPPVIEGVRVAVASRLLARMRGLLGRDSLPEGEGLLILRCNTIHTCFMRFTIDAVFLDADFRPVKTVRAIPPGRLCVWGGFRARHVLEIQARRRGGG